MVGYFPMIRLHVAGLNLERSHLGFCFRVHCYPLAKGAVVGPPHCIEEGCLHSRWGTKPIAMWCLQISIVQHFPLSGRTTEAQLAGGRDLADEGGFAVAPSFDYLIT